MTLSTAASSPRVATVLGRPFVAAMLAVAGLACASASAQTWSIEPPPSHTETVALDSGLWTNTGSDSAQVVWSGTVSVEGARWMRLAFKTLVLSGDPGRDDAAVIRLTSMKDGAVQILNAEQARRWSNTSAYFNGDAVFIELIMHRDAAGLFGASRVEIESVTVGDAPSPFGQRSICGPTDDRTLSSDARSARYLPSGCSAWLINDANKQFLTAGHCGVSNSGVCQFNVPLSNSDGSLRQPSPEDQYPVESTSIQTGYTGIGDDYSYFGCWPNSTTNQSAFERQGSTYILATSVAAPAAGDVLRITGYGTTSGPVPNTWNQVQKTHTGGYTSLSGTTVAHTVDTTGGNSGSAIENTTTGVAIGIHTNAGCSSSGGSNTGTSLDNSGLRRVLASPRGICAPGFGVLVPPVYAAGDSSRAYGTVNFETGTFARASTLGFSVDGMAYDPIRRVMWAVSTERTLARIDPQTGVGTVVGPLTGTSRATSGLAFDPRTQTLYGMIQVGGRLVTINTTTGAVTPIGAPGGNNIGALDYDIHTRTIFGIDDSSSGSRLVRVDSVTGAQTVVGFLGAGISDCNGLAYNPADRTLYTINAATEEVLAVDPATGRARLVGPSFSLWGGNFGLGCVYEYTPCTADFNGDGFLDFFDYDAFVACFETGSCGGSSADFNVDGFVDFFDYDAFVGAFEAGC